MNIRTTAVTACAALFLPGLAMAQTPTTPPAASTAATLESPANAAAETSSTAAMEPEGWHRHQGFFLRGHLGGGYRSLSFGGGTGAKASGAGPGVGVAGGATVAENLILYGEIMVEATVDPTIELGSTRVETTNITMNFLGIGPGVAYYIMPANVHVGGLLLLSSSNLKSKDRVIAESEFGFGAAVRVGKDFWISKNMGLGVLGQFSVASMKDKATNSDTATTMTAVAATLALEATLN